MTDVGVHPVVALQDEFPVLAGTFHIVGVIAVECVVAPHVCPVAEHQKFGIAHRAVLEVHLAVLHRPPPVAAVARGVVGLVKFVVDALLQACLHFLQLARVLDRVNSLLLQGVALLDDSLLRRLPR